MRALQLRAALLVGMATVAAQAADPEAVRKKAEPCTSCHGATGNSTSPDVPSLAGQPKQFITTQLVMFREGRRVNPIMAALTANMSNADINELGGWFAAQAAAPAAAPLPEPQMLAGRQRAEQLNCVQCHGAALKGQQHIPRLAGQHAVYLKAQLQGFKAQTRFDMDGNMTSAAQALTPADIDLLSNYMAALQ
jgi:cytochrome c553